MSSVAISAPSVPAATASQAPMSARSGGGALVGRSAVRPFDAPAPIARLAMSARLLQPVLLLLDPVEIVARGLGVDRDRPRQPGDEQPPRRRARLDRDPHRHALDDL